MNSSHSNKAKSETSGDKSTNPVELAYDLAVRLVYSNEVDLNASQVRNLIEPVLQKHGVLDDFKRMVKDRAGESTTLVPNKND